MKQLPAELNRCPWAKSDWYMEYHSQPHSNQAGMAGGTGKSECGLEA